MDILIHCWSELLRKKVLSRSIDNNEQWLEPIGTWTLTCYINRAQVTVIFLDHRKYIRSLNANSDTHSNVNVNTIYRVDNRMIESLSMKKSFLQYATSIMKTTICWHELNVDQPYHSYKDSKMKNRSLLEVSLFRTKIVENHWSLNNLALIVHFIFVSDKNMFVGKFSESHLQKMARLITMHLHF
jgi:hypothetical protein